MADPLSIGASVLAFVGLAERVIRAVHVCVEAVKDCPHDLQMMLCELSSMKAVFQSLTAADDPDFASTSLVRALFDKTGPVAACQRCLLGLEALLPKVEQDRPVVQRHRITLAELAWPLKQSKARKLLAEISHHKATLLLAVSGDV
jgi:hypothetical protein